MSTVEKLIEVLCERYPEIRKDNEIKSCKTFYSCEVAFFQDDFYYKASVVYGCSIFFEKYCLKEAKSIESATLSCNEFSRYYSPEVAPILAKFEEEYNAAVVELEKEKEVEKKDDIPVVSDEDFDEFSSVDVESYLSETIENSEVEEVENYGTFSNSKEEKEAPKTYKSFADYLVKHPVFVETDYVEVENEDGKNLLTPEEEEEFSRLIAEFSGPDGDGVVEEEEKEKVKEFPVVVAFPITLSDSDEEEREWVEKILVLEEKEEER